MPMSIGGSDNSSPLLPVSDVLREVPISRAFLYKLIKTGKGPVLTRIGDRVFVSRENLAAWLAQHEVAPEARAA
jgi:predicted DNA-binding transcriptional regulator AlpA